MWFVFLLQNGKKIENAYKALITQLEGCRVLAFELIFGNLRWNNMIEEVGIETYLKIFYLNELFNHKKGSQIPCKQLPLMFPRFLI